MVEIEKKNCNQQTFGHKTKEILFIKLEKYKTHMKATI